MKKPMKLITSIGIAASILATSFGTQVEASQSTGTIKIKADSLYLRNDDSFSSKIVDVLEKGDSYTVYGKSNGMYKLGNGKWTSASTKYVSYSTSKQSTASVKATTKKVTIKASNLNIRKSASFSSKVVGVAKKGQSYTVYETKNGLYRIGTNKWVSASTKYVSASGTAKKVQQTQPAKQVSSTNSKKASDVIKLGKKYIGMKYVWGSSNPKNGGFDCSGFIYYIYKNSGYDINRLNVEGYWNSVKRISTPQVGDLVFFKDTYKKGASHVGVYLGDGKFLNAASSDGVGIDSLSNSYWKKHFLGYGKFK